MTDLKTLSVLALAVALTACGGEQPSNDDGAELSEASDSLKMELTLEESKAARLIVPADANVFFANMNDGDSLSSPIHVEMGVSGMGIEPAGDIIEATGHHHILINNGSGFLEAGVVVPMDSLNLHYGKGQTETDIELAPGNYTLSLQFANGFHESYGEELSTTIGITVK